MKSVLQMSVLYLCSYLSNTLSFNEVQLWNYAETEHHKINDKFHVHSWVNISVIKLSENGVKSLGTCYFIGQKYGYVTEQFQTESGVQTS
jgi:hypothetical protein